MTAPYAIRPDAAQNAESISSGISMTMRFLPEPFPKAICCMAPTTRIASRSVDHRRGDHVEGDGPEAVTPQEGHEEAKADKNLVGGGGGGGRVALCT